MIGLSLSTSAPPPPLPRPTPNGEGTEHISHPSIPTGTTDPTSSGKGKGKDKVSGESRECTPRGDHPLDGTVHCRHRDGPDMVLAVALSAWAGEIAIKAK